MIAQKDVMPATANRRLGPRQRRRSKRVGGPGHESGKRAGSRVFCGCKDAIDPSVAEGVERANATELIVVLLQEPEQPPGIATKHVKQARQTWEQLLVAKDLPGWIANAALCELKAKNLMALSLQPDALLGHAESISNAGSA